jgi:hypothetical protein
VIYVIITLDMDYSEICDTHTGVCADGLKHRTEGDFVIYVIMTPVYVQRVVTYD